MKIIKTKSGNRYKILDKVFKDGDTNYLCKCMDTNQITQITPYNINEIYEIKKPRKFFKK